MKPGFRKGRKVRSFFRNRRRVPQQVLAINERTKSCNALAFMTMAVAAHLVASGMGRFIGTGLNRSVG